MSDGTCVECLSDAECADDPTASSCSQAGSCTACVFEEDCALIPGRSACLQSQGCVECTDDIHCADNPRGRLCNIANTPGLDGSAGTNICVECLSNTDCVEPGASLCQNNECVACQTDAECSHVDSNGNAAGGLLGVCDAGTCVECTAQNRTACLGNVCDGRVNTCTDSSARSAGFCDTCVSDDECTTDARCVQHIGLGFFCFPLQTGGGCPTTGPTRGFLEQITNATIDSPSADVCLLRDATCPAFVNYREGTPCEGIGDDVCGEGGSCGLLTNGANEFACTIPCTGQFDCVRGSCLEDVCTL